MAGRICRGPFKAQLVQGSSGLLVVHVGMPQLRSPISVLLLAAPISSFGNL